MYKNIIGKVSLLSVLIGTLIGCTSTNINSERDKDEAHVIVFSYYNKCRKKDYDGALQLLYHTLNNKKELIKVQMIANASINGENHWASLVDWKTFSQSGVGKNKGRYELVYQVAYDNDTLMEYFRLIRDTETDSIKILDHGVAGDR